MKNRVEGCLRWSTLSAPNGKTKMLHNSKLTEGLSAAKFEVDAYSCCDGKLIYKMNKIAII